MQARRLFQTVLATTIGLSLTIGGARGGIAYNTSGLAAEMVAAHNALRAKLGIEPLVWSPPLAETAQRWADTLLRTGDFAPRGDGRYGENLYEITGATTNPSDVVNAWASESRDYDAKANTCARRCGHYTQVVWRDTKTVGCGVAGDKRRQVWVCNYDPFGNVAGERPY